jgi:hypothetical protein
MTGTFTRDGARGGQSTAPRLRRPSWRDPRLLIGLLLVLASVAVGARVVASADHTVPVYAARQALPTGTPVSGDLLKVVRLRLTGTDAAYLGATGPLPPGRVTVRTIGAGELVPMAAVVPAEQLLSRPVSIPLDGAAPGGLAPGGLIDVWASAKHRDAVGGGYDEPKRIARAVEVFDVQTPTSALSGSRTGSVQVLFPEDALAPVLDALANQARLVILPVPGSVKRPEGGS